MTQLLEVNPRSPESDKITTAARIIQHGGLVAFPTETVYGLGADAMHAEAVAKIFSAKGRPSDNPLIVHIAKMDSLPLLAREIPDVARTLMDLYWPGPLTLVFKKTDRVPFVTTGGTDTVAVRMPNHPVALALIVASGVPIAAPSANRSGLPSPTTAAHVAHDLSGRVDAILDGGGCEIGLESTVLDVTEDVPLLLRPGKIGLEELQHVLGAVRVHPAIWSRLQDDADVKSPGMKYKHYSPHAEVVVLEGEPAAQKKTARELCEEFRAAGKKVAVIEQTEPKEFAKNLFARFREYDAQGVDVIIVEAVAEVELGLAIMNRLRKAASRVIDC